MLVQDLFLCCLRLGLNFGFAFHFFLFGLHGFLPLAEVSASAGDR